jgi:hypothetical protein
MVGQTELRRIQERKEWLKAASELHRCVIALEGVELERRLHWLDRAVALVQRARPLLPIAAGLAGFIAVRRGGTLFRLVGKATVGLKLLRRVTGW